MPWRPPLRQRSQRVLPSAPPVQQRPGRQPERLVRQEHPEQTVPLVRWVRPGRREPCPQQEHLEQQVRREPWEHPERPEPREPCLRQERPEHSERQVPSVHLVQKVQQARPVRREPSGH